MEGASASTQTNLPMPLLTNLSAINQRPDYPTIDLPLFLPECKQNVKMRPCPKENKKSLKVEPDMGLPASAPGKTSYPIQDGIVK